MISQAAAMMKRALCFGLVAFGLGAFTANYARELSRYEERVTLDADGSAAIRLSLAAVDWTGAEILIPVRHASLLDLQAPGFAPAAVRLLENKGNHFVALDFAGSGMSPATVEISFRVKNYFANGGTSGPFGNKELGYRFVNVTFARIGKFSAELVLPAGHVFNAVNDFSPQPRKSGMALPYAISTAQGRNIVRLAVSDVKLGDEITFNGTFKSTKKSKLLLLALIALAVAYLILFRDLPRTGGNAGGARS